jgi:hypothetical protein
MSSRRSNHVVRRRFFGPLDIIPMQAGKDRHRRSPMAIRSQPPDALPDSEHAMSSIVANITKARRAVRSDRAADAERGRARTASLPSLEELELTAEQIEEETVTVSQAAELLGIRPQAVQQLILRGSLAAFRDARGRRVITVDDLAETRAARRQGAQAKAEYDEAIAHYEATHPMPGWMLPEGTPPPLPCPTTCRLCLREGRQPATDVAADGPGTP